MLAALQYMHEAGYVHADIKSANILLKNNQKEVVYKYCSEMGPAPRVCGVVVQWNGARPADV